MRTPQVQQENGIVAILDALGASTYEDAEIQRFIESREIVLGFLNEKADEILGEDEAGEALNGATLITFTFNDTIAITLRTETEVTLQGVVAFCRLVRKFLVDSVANRILFRGAFAIGTFYANERSNIVMGQAVSDAAAWYDKSDWIGLHATPRTNLVISRFLEPEERKKRLYLFDYQVPLKQGGVLTTKAINWPRGFFVPRLSPCTPGSKPREKLLELLALHQVPKGTENKFSNTVAFFDYAVKEIQGTASK